MIIGAVLELVLITIIILECKFLIFISLVILAINIAAFTLCANLSVLKFAISSMTTLKAKLGIDNEDEALDRSIVMELIAIAVLILLLVRYYAVLTVYRWTKLPRVAAGPRITVHNIK
ncbi:MARVEL domain-containing protein [Caenorhabditis elegans]|nr:MARVEL domain-containing protein [Caenorhabditis elegans]AAF39777.1 Hypothetical protein C51G7.2 [Caenorhabditis elegans]CAX51689.1 MARVEL domain-containing protein [Caenorhabditis elegans]|eukprot:NP_001255154.1 Uncharacterized protein CELE_Y79H2A.2 [Caenorhabditis elegans]